MGPNLLTGKGIPAFVAWRNTTRSSSSLGDLNVPVGFEVNTSDHGS